MTLAEKLTSAPPAPRATRKGPIAACDIYGPGDRAAYDVIQQRRANGEYWADVQRIVDEALGIEKPIRGDNFRYHWSGKCAHWDGIDL